MLQALETSHKPKTNNFLIMNQNKKQLQREQKGWMPKDWIYKTTLGPIRGVTDDSKGEVARWAYRPDLFRSFYSFFYVLSCKGDRGGRNQFAWSW